MKNLKRRVAKRMNPDEITSTYILILLLFSFIGYAYGYTNVESINLDLNNETTVGVLYFFGHNLLFFSLISILPFLNLIMCVVNVFKIGYNVFLIQQLPYQTQFVLFYRHAIIELLVMLIAVNVSYLIFFTLKDYLDNTTEKKKVGEIVISYVGIVILTLIAAILEGTANV